MSNVVVFGATGYSGRAIAAELARRGHTVTGISRSAAPGSGPEGVRLVRGSITEPAELVRDADAVVVAVSGRDAGDPAPVEWLPKLLEVTRGKRIGFVGGAGSLRVAEGGPLLVDAPDFPAEFRAEALAHKDVLDALRAAEGVDWFYVSPAAGYGSYAPGPTTGTFRVSGDVLLTDADGHSNLSAGDLAIGIADELDTPAHRNARFHLAY
jgi:uncharacterized protein